MTVETLLIWIIVGGVAGWLAGQVVRGFGFGLVGNIIVGILGAIIAGWLFGAVGFSFFPGILNGARHKTRLMSGEWLVNAFGVAAGLCSMASFVPQIMKIVRERDASSVSLVMYAVTIVGFACWVTYGALSNAWPVVLSNSVCLVLVITIFALRLRYGDGGA